MTDIVSSPYWLKMDEPSVRIRPFDMQPIIRRLRGQEVVHPPYDRLVLASVPLLEQSGVFPRPALPRMLFHFVRIQLMDSADYRRKVGREYPPWIVRTNRMYVPVYHGCALGLAGTESRTGKPIHSAESSSWEKTRAYFYKAIRARAGAATKEARELFYRINDEGGRDGLIYDDGSRPLIVILEGKGSRDPEYGIVEALWKTIKAVYPNVAALAELSV